MTGITIALHTRTILVMGLPGSGKTTFAKKLCDLLGDATHGGLGKVKHFNADSVRQLYNDWDFSEEGRMRQARRMRELADKANSDGFHAVCDFVCPTLEAQELFKNDTIVFMDTIKKGRFEDTNKVFQRPSSFSWLVTSWQDSDNTVLNVAYDTLYDQFDFQKPLFEEALKKTGQVAIMVRTMPPSDSNPFRPIDVERQIVKKLENYIGKFTIVWVPNIVDISYGRDVGYTISKIELPEDIQAISATKIREEMRKSGEGI